MARSPEEAALALVSTTVGSMAGWQMVRLAWRSPEGAPDLARRCAEQLRERALEGDDDLADQLDAALGDRPAPMLRPIPVDLEVLADPLEGDPVHGGGRIDLRTGEVWPQAAIDDAREVGDEDPDDEDPDRWLAVWCEGSRAAYRRLEDVLGRSPCGLEAWYAFSGERQRGPARAWLAAAGYSRRVPGRPTSA